MLRQFSRQARQPVGENVAGIGDDKLPGGSLLERRADIYVKAVRLRRLVPDGLAIGILLFRLPRRFGERLHHRPA